ncbi:MAG: hypothetical protein M0C28_02975 [Candidatus Moduliflexus flocculans]|nr:hypothetical protein [Candidatus Moduliflexus flocculans]
MERGRHPPSGRAPGLQVPGQDRTIRAIKGTKVRPLQPEGGSGEKDQVQGFPEHLFKNGRWWVLIQINGKRYHREAGATEAQAKFRDALKTWKRDRNAGGLRKEPEGQPFRFKDLTADYLALYAKRNGHSRRTNAPSKFSGVSFWMAGPGHQRPGRGAIPGLRGRKIRGHRQPGTGMPSDDALQGGRVG